ncbi:MAG: AAA family ATPase [Anaerolineae bacterium]|nr:AAA family ATPase [Anaerolineae bacterium]
MISRLEIRNFKSIRHLTLDCRRVNVFIGEPNTGKSNILEAIGLFSAPYTGSFRDFVRMEDMADLFCDNNLEETIKIRARGHRFDGEFECAFRHEEGIVKGSLTVPGMDLESEAGKIRLSPAIVEFKDDRLQLESVQRQPKGQPVVKFYRFASDVSFQRIPSLFLLPPDGKNLPFLLLSNKALKKSLGDLFAPFGLLVVVDYRGEFLKVQREIGEEIAQFPWCAISDTLRRMAFYLAAIETNRDSVLVFEEPESHAFPYYTKYLAERIALEDSNQYFLSTHNPYLLVPLLEKTPAEELAIFVTYFRENQTMVKPIAGREERGRVLDLDLADIFLNLDLLVDEGSW